MLNSMNSWEKYAVVLLSIAIGVLIIAPAAYFRYWDGGYKGADFFGSGNEDFYLAQIQEIYDGHWSLGNVYLAEGKNDPYVQQPLPAMMVAFLGKILGVSSRDINLLTKFLFPAILTVIAYLFFSNVFGRKDIAIVMTGFVMLVQASWIFLNPSAWLPFFLKGEFVGVNHNFISYARPINPQISSLFFFGYLLCAWKFLFGQLSQKSEKIYGIAGAIIWGLSFYVYFFTFSFLSVLNGVLLLWFGYAKDWRQLKKMLLVSAGASLLALPYLLHLLKMMQSPWYIQLTRRLGMADTRQFIFSRVWWGVTALFLLLYWGSREVKIFILAFLATAFIVTNQQMLTGKTLSLPAHYHWYYIAPIGGAILIYLFFSYFEKIVPLWASRAAMILLLGLFFYAGILYQKTSYLLGKEWAISSQRYAPVFSWLEQNISKESSIFANQDLSNLIPDYTRHNVYRGTGDTLISEERLKHPLYIYFYLNGVTKDSAGDYFYNNRNPIGAEIFGQYYRQKNGCYGCFSDDILNTWISEYQSFLEKDFVTELKKYPADYVIWDKAQNPEWRLDRFFTDKTYEVDNLVIFKI
ncbi:MAG: hypothetical protein A3I89_02150 [Candidatus Harrisonbacteria bacterium RIFCSPLOWO2_02_FULL_41_11]|uniref:Glycosyltransferase RgtA/B/C/D-like domain-containing protein n=1 Tax=Candidatus Harrisonbacteria bacterium RIFCSPHIGHO2_02_FULL_42_16 TaxID=1798404 RepID=A0A1G1ZG70_9BACT|nr:MAG: hypothetical protein A3B92_01620 [Candidatus Harrisonbacteria bacterium RIFCSPHIGHO2_02_FULL_42_16]OGY65660.1 MAG: hypothetical protein A3I89_02150 [Candidatus Harrisonbacteria bacterium RIFCSPLOWO2_02_FULL_41_11]